MKYIRYFILALGIALVVLYVILFPLCVGDIASVIRARIESFASPSSGEPLSIGVLYGNLCRANSAWIRRFALPAAFFLVALYLFIELRLAKPKSKEAKKFARGYLFFLLLGIVFSFYSALRHHPALDSSSKLMGVLPEKSVYRPRAFIEVGTLGDGGEAEVDITFAPRSLSKARNPSTLPLVLPEKCKFSKEELLKLRDEDAEWIVWNSMALLRADFLSIINSAGTKDSEIPDAYHRGMLEPQYLDNLVFQTKYCALQRLAYLGTFASGASDDVFSYLSDPKYSDRAKNTLIRIGGPKEAKVPALVSLLYGRDVHLRNSAFSVLESLGEQGIGVILQELVSDNKEVRESAYKLILKNGMENQQALKALIDASKDPRSEVRALAFSGLKEHRTRSEEVVALGINALSDQNEKVRISAVEVLNSYGETARSALEPLFSLIVTDKSNARASAVRAAGTIGKNLPDTATRLVESVYSVKEVLSISPSILRCNLFYPSLTITQQQRWDERDRFSTSIDSTPVVLKEVLVSYGEKILPQVDVFLDDPKPHVQDLACGILKELKPEGFKSHEKVKKLLASESVWVRISAFKALIALNGVSDENLSYLKTLEGSKEYKGCLEEGSFLKHLGEIGDPIFPPLMEAFKLATGNARCNLAQAIQDTFPLDQKRFDEIVSVLEITRWHDRCVVFALIRGLSNIRPIDARVLAKLQSFYLGDGFPECKDAPWKESAMYPLIKLSREDRSIFDILHKGASNLFPGRRSFLQMELRKIDDPGAKSLLNEMADEDRLDLKNKESTSAGRRMDMLYRGEFCPNEKGEWVIKKIPSKLHVLALRGTASDLQQIIDNGGVDVNGYGYGCTTPLFEAVKEGRREISEYLLSKGADPNLGNGDNVTPLMMAVERGDEALINILLEKGGDLNKVNTYGESALTKSLFGRKLKVARTLLLGGADPNIGKSFPTGESPFTMAIQFGDTELTSLLIERGADLKLTNNQGKTALHEVATKGTKELYDFLVEKGGRPDVLDCDGFTPEEYLSKKTNRKP